MILYLLEGLGSGKVGKSPMLVVEVGGDGEEDSEYHHQDQPQERKKDRR